MRWSVGQLEPGAVSVSASRRTDIPALFAPWFVRRLREGFAEYIPLGPPRRIRRSLAPAHVTHFNFWSKWPRPFFDALEQVQQIGYPVLWNVTITGLGATDVEPHVPAPARVVAATRELARRVGPQAILWRYDPLVLSRRFDADHHRRTFRELAEQLTGHVDRVAISAVSHYGRQVAPDLRAYQRESGDVLVDATTAPLAALIGELGQIAGEVGLSLTICCCPELRAELGLPRSGCNSFAWARRVYPELEQHRRLRARPCRSDCGCSEEVDIGVYDTCVLGCRYSYGSRSEAKAHARFVRHDPAAPCLLP